MSDARLGGLVLDVDGTRVFAPATVAQKIAAIPAMAPVSGPSELLGITLFEGEIMPILSIGRARTCLIVCTHQGEKMGIVGAQVVEAGRFEVDVDRPDSIRYEGRRVALLDLEQLYAKVQGRSWREHSALSVNDVVP